MYKIMWGTPHGPGKSLVYVILLSPAGEELNSALATALTTQSQVEALFHEDGSLARNATVEHVGYTSSMA